ncbi:GNAT family N-acetyltransferase [Clostridium sp. C8-1-8]|uniref:GNAT family N-acetyltransferase n=1 Tax=Clostridium sp. C8-1-8 TaxID=2698831 RepID=UPI00136E6ACB|nr:GNAT family N-acetyltransferase [Clostridium sp. C8-1-8]
MNNKIIIETDRLFITELDESMIESVHLNSLDDDNRRFVPDEVFETIDKARETVEWLISCYQGDEGPFLYPMLLKDGKNIGYVQAVQIENGWEIGYHVAKKYTGNGYSTEAVIAFLPVILKQLNISSIYGICLEENIASQRVLDKCGFVMEYAGLGSYQGVERPIRRYKYSI